MRYFEYTCNQGDRWDLIALRYYGARFNTRTLIRANAKHKGVLVFKGGERLQIPILEGDQMAEQSQPLPAWRRP